MTCKTCAGYTREGIGVRCTIMQTYFHDPEGHCEFYMDNIEPEIEPEDETQGELF